MTTRNTILTDAAAGLWLDEFRLSQRELALPGATEWSISKRTLRGGPSDGIDVVTLDNGALCVEILPTRGMGLWRGHFAGEYLGWRSPNRFPVHPSLVNVAANKGHGWLAGFNEWMCRCGLESIGPPEGGASLHGRIANLSAHFVSCTVDDEGAGRLSVRGIVEETALFGPKLRMESVVASDAGSSVLEVEDVILNCSDEPTAIQLLYHFNFGPPWLGAGARVHAAVSEVAPYDLHSSQHIDRWIECDAPAPGAVQQCYLLKPLPIAPGTGGIMLVNAGGDRAVEIRFGLDELPCLTLWKYFAGERDGYVIGLEPGTSYPNLRSQESQAGRVRRLDPGEDVKLRCTFRALTDKAAILDSVCRYEQLQRESRTRLLTDPV
jgi:hypothetical protein